MDEPRNPDELRELLGAFALGAVDESERAEVQELILYDADARAELHQLEHAVAWLGHASPRPSGGAWDAVSAEIEADAVDRPGDTPAGAASPTAPVVDLAGARGRRRRWAQLGAVAAAVALVVGVLAVVDRNDGGPAPAEVVALRAPDGALAVQAEIDPDGNGRIDLARLPVPPAGHEYQLWAQATPRDPLASAGLLGRDPEGATFTAPPDAVLLAISVEPTGGSAAPTSDPVAVSPPLS